MSQIPTGKSPEISFFSSHAPGNYLNIGGRKRPIPGGNSQGCSRVVTLPAGRVMRCSKIHGSGQVGSRSARNLMGRVGLGQKVCKSRGLGQVGSLFFRKSRVGSSRVKRFPNLADRVASGRVKKFSNLPGRVKLDQEVTKGSRVGSGYDPRETGQLRVGLAQPASCFPLTRGSDPRIRPADRILQKLPSFCPTASLEALPNSTIFVRVSYSYIETPPKIHAHFRIHPYPLQQGHISLRGTTIDIDLCSKC